jgi:hypothetical protein
LSELSTTAGEPVAGQRRCDLVTDVPGLAHTHERTTLPRPSTQPRIISTRPPERLVQARVQALHFGHFEFDGRGGLYRGNPFDARC